MAERGHTSSMTSVTEYDSSIDSESDTTESSNSNVTSSLLSSTDTDDKLTPSLGGISISATSQTKDRTEICRDGNQTGVKRSQPSLSHGDTSRQGQLTFIQDHRTFHHHPPKRVALNRKHRPQDRILLSTLSRGTRTLGNLNNNANCSGENMGVDDCDNKLSTDFSDTSSRAGAELLTKNNLSTATSPEDESVQEENNPDECEEGISAHVETQPWEPDMSSSTWYQAGCFSRYWSHYGFVMAWYRAHMDAVRRLHRDMLGMHGDLKDSRGNPFSPRLAEQRGSNSVRHNRRARRARNRRSTKAKRKAAKSSLERNSFDKSVNGRNAVASTLEDASDAPVGEEEDEEMEMEITEDMMAFFTTSLKHRMERDIAKSGASTEETETKTRVNIEDATTGQTGPSTAPPQERPGARRAQEMKQLYGTGAPMIHGMETALQMTFDRIQDKYQTKLWPNMPLKIIFG